MGTKGKAIEGVVLDRQFRAWFGTCPCVCFLVWKGLIKIKWFQKNRIKHPDSRHLLWALRFMKGYEVQEIHAGEVGTDEKTWQKWMWKYIEAITRLSKHVVCFSCIFWSYIFV